MGIIAKQSIYNTLSIFFAFFLGGINTLFLYPAFLNETLYGLVAALLAFSNILQPILSFGVQHTLIKFYSTCKSEKEKKSLLVFSIIIPLFFIIPISLVFIFNYNFISNFLSTENPLIYEYVFIILLISIATSYFEIFYSWLKINMKTITGNFLKEVYPRMLIFLLLILFFFQILNFRSFIYSIIGGYYLRLLIIIFLGLKEYKYNFIFNFKDFSSEWIKYSFFIFLSAFAASIIIDIDKSMISKLLALENVAYYAVAVFIAAVIDTPSRAMFQIVNPLVSKAISNNDKNRLEELLKKSSMSLFLISGLIFLLINTNIGDIYNVVESINKIQGYSIAIPVVLIISISKLYTSTIGCMNNIISNSNFYQYILFFSIFSALSLFFLNIYFIENIGLIGAAYSTLIIIVVFNLLKIILVLVKLKIQPYSINSIKLFFIITVLYLIFSNLEFDFLSAISSLIIKSIIISIIYTSICYYLNISKEINNVINSFIKKIRPEKGNQA